MVSPKNHKPRPFVIGLVGGIASGKSHVAAMFESLGVPRIDADALAHEVLARPLIARRLGQVFGEHILAADSSVDRRAIASIVFGDSEQARQSRKKLEEIVHPLVHAAAVHELRLLNEASPPHQAVVIDAPLLLEANWAPMCHAILFIDTPEELRLQRSLTRGWSEEQFRRREASQMPLSEKRQHATHLIDGSTDDATLKHRLTRLLAELS
ncbi:MAG: dephospho-CoA kinase [Pirellulaceae bacterium]